MVVRTAAFLVLATVAMPALADSTRHGGPHPLPEDAQGSFCYIGVPHAHSFAPDPRDEFGRDGAALVFVGDPLERGYEGPVVPYRGGHPVAGGERCEREGDHFHLDMPANLDDYVEHAGAYAHRETLRALHQRQRAEAEAQRAQQARARQAAQQARAQQARARQAAQQARAQRERRERERAAARRAAERTQPAEAPAPPARAARRSSDEQRDSAHRAWMRRRRGH